MCRSFYKKILTDISLQKVLLIPLLVLTIFAMTLVGYFSFRNGQQAVNTVAGQLRHEINTRIREHLHSFLAQPMQINDMNAQAFSRGMPDVHDQAVLERYFWEQIQLFESVTSINFGNTAGGLANAGREGVGGAEYIIGTDGFVSGSFYKYAVDSKGNRIERLDTIPNFDARERSWYRDAVEKGGSIWSHVYILFTGQDKCISVSRPVYGDRQQLLGVTAVNIFLSHLGDFLAGMEVGQTGESFIMERSGLLIASSTREKPFTRVDGTQTHQRRLATESHISLTRGTAVALREQFGEYEAISQDQQFIFQLQGQRMLGQVTPFIHPYGLDWLIVTVIPEMDFMAQINANQQTTISLIVVTFLVIAGVSIFITRRITYPISQLQQAAGTLAKGEWDQSIHQPSQIKEINALYQSFHHMAGQLQQMVAGLNQEIADRRQVEEKLKESEERFRSISDFALDAVIMMDHEGRVVYWSPSAETIFGYQRDAVMGKDVHELLMPEKYREKYEEGFAHFKETGQGAVIGRVLELTAEDKDGKEISIEIAVSPVRYADGYWASAIIRDISARKMMEEKMVRQHEIQRLVANISYSFIHVPKVWLKEAINNALYRIGVFYGVDRTYLFQLSSDQTRLFTIHEWCEEGIASQLQNKQSIFIEEIPWIMKEIRSKRSVFIHDVEQFVHEEEKRLFHRQGLQSVLIIPIIKEEQLFGFFGMDSIKKKTFWNEEEITLLEVVGEIISNVFAKEQIEEELIESETRYRTLVSNIPGVIFRCAFDQSFTMRFISDDMEEMTGYPPQVFIENKGRSYSSLIHPEDREMVRTVIQESCAVRTSYTVQYRILHAKGCVRWVQENGQGIMDRDGRISYIDGVIFDITQRKKAEEKLDQRTRELEQEMEKAQEVHERILPTALPTIEGLSFAAFYQPAQKLGSDFYDVIQVGHYLVTYLSDVSGHGLDGSMLSVFVKYTIKNFLSSKNLESLSPSEILRYLAHRFTEENYPEEYFICIFLGVLNLKTMEFKYSGAGFQDTPLVRMGDGEQLKLLHKGLFITSFLSPEWMNYQEKSILLTPGTTIFFNTDGLTEQRAFSTSYRERLYPLFYAHASLPPLQISQVIRNDFCDFNRGSLESSDDITFFILQLDPVIKDSIHLELDTDWNELKKMQRIIKEQLHGYKEEVNLLLSSLNELVANAMEHGNRMHPQKKVVVDVTIKEEYIQVSVADEGEGFVWQEILQKPLALDGSSDRGRGIPMTQLFSDGLFYNRRGNRATFFVSIRQE